VTQSSPDDEDIRLRALFSAAEEPISDAGFSQRVMRRITLHALRRRVVLGIASVVGLGIAARPLWEITPTLGDALIVGGERLATLTAWLAHPAVLAAVASIMIAPATLHWLDE
jgi:hypothetical protein